MKHTTYYCKKCKRPSSAMQSVPGHVSFKKKEQMMEAGFMAPLLNEVLRCPCGHECCWGDLLAVTEVIEKEKERRWRRSSYVY